ncbi:spore coat protein [Bacillus sp. BHET2]|uniref:spore coat protein n=1 Tax=Bacillus sp. BHET2 TaxID=2583818 RepID=UPI00110F0769|nr:spore coat protein [Bacillus sp. BHET2]TMU84449.1 spore coat protein [Bacillus sp. BHET2]
MNDFQTFSNESYVDFTNVRRPVGRVGFGRPGFGYGGFGRRPFGFGYPFLGGLAGGLLGASLLSPYGYGYGYGYGYPPPYYGYQPYPYPYY